MLSYNLNRFKCRLYRTTQQSNSQSSTTSVLSKSSKQGTISTKPSYQSKKTSKLAMVHWCRICSCSSKILRVILWPIWTRIWSLWGSMGLRLAWCFMWMISILDLSTNRSKALKVSRNMWWVRKITRSCRKLSANGKKISLKTILKSLSRIKRSL